MKYCLVSLIIIVTFFSCKNFNRNASLKVSAEKLDTIQTSPANIVTVPTLFETAFINGATAKINTSDIRVDDPNSKVYGVTIGKIKIVSGHIIACDPLHTDEYGIPFTQTFPKGEFPVQLSIAKLDNKEVIAFARINFSDAPVAKWELALIEGQKLLPVGIDKIEGYGIDGGIGIFIDEEAKKVFDKNKLIDDRLYGPLMKEMDRHYHNTWRFAMYTSGQHNLAAFTTGIGDGHYATYIGYDTNGKICRLLSDFGLLEWRKK